MQIYLQDVNEASLSTSKVFFVLNLHRTHIYPSYSLQLDLQKIKLRQLYTLRNVLFTKHTNKANSKSKCLNTKLENEMSFLH